MIKIATLLLEKRKPSLTIYLINTINKGNEIVSQER